MAHIQTTIAQLQQIVPLVLNAPDKQPIGLIGSVGIAKTQSFKGWFRDMYAEHVGVSADQLGFIQERVANRDSAEIAGVALPSKDANGDLFTQFTKPPLITKIEQTKCEYGIILFDELMQATADVQKVLADVLDPAASKVAQKTVKASRYFTRVEDALNREWHGRVFMNPPYCRDDMPRFAEKLIGEFQAGWVSEAIALVHSLTDPGWFHDLAACAAAICFTRGRIPFLSPYGEANAPVHGSAFFYLGHNILDRPDFPFFFVLDAKSTLAMPTSVRHLDIGPRMIFEIAVTLILLM